MYAILGAAAGAASIGGLIYSSRISATTAESKGRQEGRREVLGELVKFGPNRLRRMCLEIGMRFSDPENEDGDEERELYEGLTAQIRAVLEAELRRSMRADVENKVRDELKREVKSDPRSMERLREDAKELVRNDFRKSGEVRAEVRTEEKRKIRAELTRSGRDVQLVAEAISDLREETREDLRSRMRAEVKWELRREMSESVRAELRRELRGEVKQSLKGELKIEARSVEGESRGAKAERFLETSASVWTDDTALAGTRRR